MKKKSKYRPESLPQYILRCAPIGRTAMQALIARVDATEKDMQDLENEIERINLRSIELLEKHARPEFIERAREELNLLALAKSVLCDG